MSITAVPIPPTKRGTLVILWLGIVLAVALAGLLAFYGTAHAVAEKGDNAAFLAYNKTQAGVIETESGLQYRVIKPGTGDLQPTDADVALINYSGSLRDGSVFDASKQPTPLPVAGVVKGFSEALKLMKKGEKIRAWIKPELGYGEQSPDPNKMPPNSLLVFDIELLEFLPESVLRQAQQQQQMQQQQQIPGGPPQGAVPPPAPGQ
ncbi:MAG: peptidylprolyl isomerase [Proteobacteria bacterium ST_bin13]|nr:MAG: peptidylprolyl isomerase [Proteobacteria bacterium ST_bin13]